jgi:hypothetical protein
VAHTYNPGYSGSRDEEITIPSWPGQIVCETLSWKYVTQKDSRCRPWVQAPVLQKKKKLRTIAPNILTGLATQYPAFLWVFLFCFVLFCLAGVELRPSHLLGKCSYHLSHSTSSILFRRDCLMFSTISYCWCQFLRDILAFLFRLVSTVVSFYKETFPRLPSTLQCSILNIVAWGAVTSQTWEGFKCSCKG